jgi:hypothetical protein
MLDAAHFSGQLIGALQYWSDHDTFELRRSPIAYGRQGPELDAPVRLRVKPSRNQNVIIEMLIILFDEEMLYHA